MILLHKCARVHMWEFFVDVGEIITQLLGKRQYVYVLQLRDVFKPTKNYHIVVNELKVNAF